MRHSPLVIELNVAKRNEHSLGESFSPCTCICLISLYEHAHASPIIVKQGLNEMFKNDSSQKYLLHWNRKSSSSCEQFATLRYSISWDLLTICTRWWLVIPVLSRSNCKSPLNTLRGIRKYSVPMFERSSYSHFLIFLLRNFVDCFPKMTFHQVWLEIPALTKSEGQRKVKTNHQMFEWTSIVYHKEWLYEQGGLQQ